MTYGAKYGTVALSYDDLDRPDGWTLTLGNPLTGQTFTQDVTYGAADRVEGLVWTEGSGTGDHVIDTTFYANGWPHEKWVDGMEPFTWEYDELGRVDAFLHGGGPLESYRYDPVGNPEEMTRNDGGVGIPDEFWTYAAATRFSEIPSRSRPKGNFTITDEMGYDGLTSRLTSWNTDDTDPNGTDIDRSFVYDGSGRLRQMSKTGGKITNLRYDVDDQLVWEERVIPGPDILVYRTGGYRREGANTIEQVLPMVRLESGKLRVVYTEPDGHANWTLNTEAGQSDTTNLIGVYGMDLLKFPATGSWMLDGFHGSEPNRVHETMQFGVRHTVLRDGMWMQPEPLLYLGLPTEELPDPRGFSGAYAAGAPSVYADPSGYILNVTGTAVSGFETGVENALGGGVDIEVAENGDVSMTPADGFKPSELSGSQQGLYTALQLTVHSEGTTHLNLVRNSPGVRVGRIKSEVTPVHTVDLGDLAQLGPDEPSSAPMALTHELIEAHHTETLHFAKAPAHEAARLFTAAYSGWTVSGSRTIESGDWRISTSTYVHRGGDIATVVLKERLLVREQPSTQPLQVERR